MFFIMALALAAQPVAPDKLLDEREQAAISMLSLERFERIRLGMTYSEVVSLIGPPSRTQFETIAGGMHLVTYQWGDGTVPLVLVTFQNGRVSLRTQMGLK